MDIKATLGLPRGIEGKSFSEAAKYIEDLFKERNDHASLSTKKAFMLRLRDAQEMQKQEMQQQGAQQGQFAYGGMQNQYDNGGGVNKFGDVIPEYVDPVSPANIQVSEPLDSSMSDLNVMSQGLNIGTTSDNSGFFKKNAKSILGGIGLATSALAPMLANRSAMKNLKKPKTVQTGQLDPNLFSPNFVNRQQLERNLANQSSTSRQAARQQGLSQGQLAGTYQGIHSSSANALANILLQSNLADAGEKSRVQQGRAGIAQTNLQQQGITANINAQNEAAYESQMGAYRQGIGANIGAVGKSAFNFMQASNYSKYAGQAAKLAALNQ